MGTDDGEARVPNQYLQALEDQVAPTGPQAQLLHDALRGAVTAMQAGAWLSRKATQWTTELSGRNTQLGTAADSVMNTLWDQIRAQRAKGDLVPAHTFEADFYRDQHRRGLDQ